MSPTQPEGNVKKGAVTHDSVPAGTWGCVYWQGGRNRRINDTVFNYMNDGFLVTVRKVDVNFFKSAHGTLSYDI